MTSSFASILGLKFLDIMQHLPHKQPTEHDIAGPHFHPFQTVWTRFISIFVRGGIPIKSRASDFVSAFFFF
jgi:hypothetical protein